MLISIPLPDHGYFGRIGKTTNTPLNSIWVVVFFGFLPGLLHLDVPVATNAIISAVMGV